MGELAGVDVLTQYLTEEQKKYNYGMLSAIRELAKEYNTGCINILFDNIYLQLEDSLSREQTTQMINYMCGVADTYNSIKRSRAIKTQHTFHNYLHS